MSDLNRQENRQKPANQEFTDRINQILREATLSDTGPIVRAAEVLGISTDLSLSGNEGISAIFLKAAEPIREALKGKENPTIQDLQQTVEAVEILKRLLEINNAQRAQRAAYSYHHVRSTKFPSIPDDIKELSDGNLLVINEGFPAYILEHNRKLSMTSGLPDDPAVKELLPDDKVFTFHRLENSGEIHRRIKGTRFSAESYHSLPPDEALCAQPCLLKEHQLLLVGATGRVWGLDLKQGTEAEFQEIARLRKNCITIQIVALSTGEIVTLNSEGDLEVLRNTGKENERETAQLISPKLTKAPSFVMPLKGGGFILSRDSREIEIWKARDTNHGIDYTLNSSLVLSESPSHIEELPGDRLAIGFPSGLISITSMVSGKTEELWRCQNDYEVTALKLLSDGTLLVGEGCYRSYMDPAFLHEFKPGEGPSSTKESI